MSVNDVGPSGTSKGRNTMSTASRLYETTFVVNAALDDPQIDAVIDKVTELITKNGGRVQDLNKWGRKRFAYPIKKKNNGFYVVIEFTAPGDLIAKLERHYHLDEDIIRYLTVQLSKKALKAKATPVAAVAEPVPAASAPQAGPGSDEEDDESDDDAT
jgi:small subunit ribosomal protein S6